MKTLTELMSLKDEIQVLDWDDFVELYTCENPSTHQWTAYSRDWEEFGPYNTKSEAILHLSKAWAAKPKELVN